MSKHPKMPHSPGGYHPGPLTSRHAKKLAAAAIAADLLATLGVQPAAVRERLADV
jgi:hypothetical protein